MLESKNKLEEKFGQEKSTLEEQIKKLQEELADKNNNSNESTRAVDEENTRLEAQIEQLKTDIAAAKQREEQVQRELDTLRTELESSQQHHESDKIRFKEREEELAVSLLRPPYIGMCSNFSKCFRTERVSCKISAPRTKKC